ncbi:DUF4157 domain-containing protein [Streptomyces spiramenti]|uniref:DUF4157 domain-containing protein n=1 Tax=Streptomyces spiramenti TaxID=2720606 RepID=A0ABX1AN87_9ACTN|nr:DUF4157 domain-containing protein [Streptomyces spiramenti]NJP65735.1 DUF4157 domain-containing protein [Streptomyces spiramenti]
MMRLQQAAGNMAVARAVEEARHEHGPGCGHGQADAAPAGQLDLINEAMATPSTQLPGAFLSKAQSFYQNDRLSAGRVHSNPTAQRATEAMGARAMTIDNHIFLGASAIGDTETLAHEASHLNANLSGVKETGTTNDAGITVTDPAQGSEIAAMTDGAAFAAGADTAPSIVAQRSAADDHAEDHSA